MKQRVSEEWDGADPNQFKEKFCSVGEKGSFACIAPDGKYEGNVIWTGSIKLYIQIQTKVILEILKNLFSSS